MNLFKTFFFDVLVYCSLAMALAIPKVEDIERRGETSTSTSKCSPFVWTTNTLTNTFYSTDVDGNVLTSYETQTISGRTLAPCALSFLPTTTIQTTVPSTTLVSTFTHCDENPHCTSTFWTTPICASETVFASCYVGITELFQENGYTASVSTTSCNSPPGATGSFQCHETTARIGLDGVSSTFTVTNCDIADFTCVTLSSGISSSYTPTTTPLPSTQFSTPFSTPSSSTLSSTPLSSNPPSSTLSSTSPSSTPLSSTSSSTLFSTASSSTSTPSTPFSTPSSSTLSSTPLSSNPPSSVSTTSLTTFITDCGFSRVPVTCVPGVTVVPVGTNDVSIITYSCAPPAGNTISGSFVNSQSVTTYFNGITTTVVTVSNAIIPSFSCPALSPSFTPSSAQYSTLVTSTSKSKLVSLTSFPPTTTTKSLSSVTASSCVPVPSTSTTIITDCDSNMLTAKCVEGVSATLMKDVILWFTTTSCAVPNNLSGSFGPSTMIKSYSTGAIVTSFELTDYVIPSFVCPNSKSSIVVPNKSVVTTSTTAVLKISHCSDERCSDSKTTLASTPVASTPVASTPVESTPVESTPVESTPVESTPVESTPVESTPVESTPVESTPVESTPVESTPVESTPVESTPVESTPVESTPVASTPVESTPAGVTNTPATSFFNSSSQTLGSFITPSIKSSNLAGTRSTSVPAETSTISSSTVPKQVTYEGAGIKYTPTNMINLVFGVVMVAL
ncbi:uncharacterized protein C5L36_0E00750 [Pichia kudriavzevii]|uniref:Uncharacterized protein n=1 Tax=Pichia kudriavzevii TaxID=4909 RepID=A0A2U9RAT6_PICKU|nr:uncharacterized protein C5L36_0E00750 [Pichia kudriavzevii]AWU78008.1 hypothetical protein C5L36_0E00750 [Pichia kudriavzevii]